MPRNYKVYLTDILEAITKIESYAKDLSYEEFLTNDLVQDAIIRNLEVIGEAVKGVPNDIKNSNQNIEWRKIAGLRDILIHEYFGIDHEIIWDVISNKLETLKIKISEIKNKMK
ncbi:MAG: DUF86 domain-containing protein [Pseudomonadota bacterium]